MIKFYYISEGKKTRHLPENFFQITPEDFLTEIPSDAGCFVISTSSPELAYKVLSAVRKSSSKNIYLAPCFLITSAEEDYFKNIVNMFDSVFFSVGITDYISDKIYNFSAPVIIRIKELPDTKDTIVSLKIIRFAYSREKKIKPEMTSENIYGFIYPKIKSFLKKNDFNFFKMLHFLELNNLIEGEFSDISHFCSNCGSAFMNFREICPDCKSPDIVSQNLIHHFKCAHIAPEEEFYKGDNIVCPKCRDTLNHIGVDFDKPSVVFTCRSCSNVFQEPETDTKCFNCKVTNYPENQTKLTIKEYSLTSMGENACFHGLDSMFKAVIKEDLPLIPYKVFKKIVESESERIKRYAKSVSTLVYIEISGIEELYTEMGANAKSIFAELSSIIKSMLRVSDFIASMSESAFVALLTETDISGAQSALDRLSKRIERLIKKNTSKKLKVVTGYSPVIADKSSEQIIKEIIYINE